MAKNLARAIIDRAMATTALASLLVGGITFGLARRGTPAPYGSLHDIAGGDDHTTGTYYIRSRVYQLSLFADSVDELDTIGTLLEGTFNHKMAPLVFGDGRHMLVQAGPWRYVGEEVGPAGGPLHHGYVELITMHSRNY